MASVVESAPQVHDDDAVLGWVALGESAVDQRREFIRARISEGSPAVDVHAPPVRWRFTQRIEGEEHPGEAGERSLRIRV